jgi:Leucine-rich repeat (LRR) protein
LQFDINGKIISLLSGNIFLTDLKKCQIYYDILGKKLKDDNIFFTHLTISYLPFEYGKNYFENIIIKNNTAKNLKKLDLSYNNLTCDVLFKFFQNNVNFFSLKDLNLSGNQLDDIFFEKFLKYNYHSIFKKLEKINLKGNLIGNESIIKFDNLGEEPKNDKNRMLDIYKFRLIYKFIEKNKNLSKLYLTENPISEKLMIVTKSEEIAIEKDEQNNIIIDSFYSLLVKIKEELSMNKEEKINRGQFIIKFDIDRYINLDSESFDYKKKLIKFK